LTLIINLSTKALDNFKGVNILKKLLFILASYICLSSSASAYQIRVLERVSTPSCSYFSVVNGEYHVLVSAPELMDSKVELQMGWNGMNGNKSFTWQGRKAVKPSRKLGHSLVFSINNDLVSRGNPVRFSGFSFRIKVMRPSGRVNWLTGSPVQGSFFTVESNLSRLPCRGEKRIPYSKAKLVVENTGNR
jgi:hypothetical protein